MKLRWFAWLASISLLCAGCAGIPDSITGSVEPSTVPAPVLHSSAPEPTFTSTPEPSPTPEPLLQMGVTSPSVARLQARLMELGYMEQAAPTEYFGSQTEKAVRTFQRQSGIAEDGIAGADILALLYAAGAQPYEKPALPLAGLTIGIDPGHQAKGNSAREPEAPGSSKMKKKVSSGTQGRWSRVPEYEVNLAVGLLLRDLLREQGATVIMTRETNDVDISNVERAQLFNRKKVDYALRLHCNGKDDESVHGAFMLIPRENPFAEDCKQAAALLLDSYCAATGAKHLGVTKRSDQTGFNWCERMIVNIEMGHMTNKAEDARLTSPDYQKKMAQGLLDGICAYFEKKER